jgi:hypothetical protein
MVVMCTIKEKGVLQIVLPIIHHWCIAHVTRYPIGIFENSHGVLLKRNYSYVLGIFICR